MSVSIVSGSFTFAAQCRIQLFVDDDAHTEERMHLAIWEAIDAREADRAAGLMEKHFTDTISALAKAGFN